MKGCSTESTEIFSHGGTKDAEKIDVKFPPVCVLRTGRRRRDAATALVLQVNG